MKREVCEGMLPAEPVLLVQILLIAVNGDRPQHWGLSLSSQVIGPFVFAPPAVFAGGMPRGPRTEESHAQYLVSSRGNYRTVIFTD